MRSEVNEVHLFRQILDEQRDPRAVLKEAISNAYDAGAASVEIELTARGQDRLDIFIRDDGAGLDRGGLRRFFGLGFSDKENAGGSIGEKGLGSKLLFNSQRVVLTTRASGEHGLQAILEDPRGELQSNALPSYHVTEARGRVSRGTSVCIEGYRAGSSLKAFSPEHLSPYLRWFTAAGQATRLMTGASSRLRARVNWRDFPIQPDELLIHGHELPENSVAGSPFARRFPPFAFGLRNERGDLLGNVEIAGAILESDAHLVRNKFIRKPYKGFFLCKDHFAIRSANDEIAGGTGVWQNFHVLVNCQQLDLGASREDFVNTGDGSVYRSLVDALREFLRCTIRTTPFSYLGRAIESKTAYAGLYYAELKKKKLADKLLYRRQGHAIDVVALSRKPRQAQRGMPLYEPEDELGTLVWFQAATRHRAVALKYELAHASRALGGTAVIRVRGGDTVATKVFAICVVASKAKLDEAKSIGLDGLLAWKRGDAESDAIVVEELLR